MNRFSTLFLVSEEDKKTINPFKVPPDHDIFALRDKEKHKKKEV